MLEDIILFSSLLEKKLTFSSQSSNSGSSIINVFKENHDSLSSTDSEGLWIIFIICPKGCIQPSAKNAIFASPLSQNQIRHLNIYSFRTFHSKIQNTRKKLLKNCPLFTPV